MASLLDLELPANIIHHVVRGRSCRFIDENRPVKSIELMHAQWAELRAFLMALITCRCAESGFPGTRAPAAALCPPPPNCSAILFTSTFSVFERRLIRVSSGSISSNTHATQTDSIARI